MTCMASIPCVARLDHFQAGVSSLVTSGDHAMRDSYGYEGACFRRPAPALVFELATHAAYTDSRICACRCRCPSGCPRSCLRRCLRSCIRIVLKRALAPPAGAVSRLPLRAATHALASLCSTHIQKSVAGTHTSCLVMRVVALRAHYGPPPESILTSQVATGGGLQPQGA